MYTLKVSRNCGLSYEPYCQTETIEGIMHLLEDLDAQGLRWTIEDEKGEPCGPMCARHAAIIAMLQTLNSKTIAP